MRDTIGLMQQMQRLVQAACKKAVEKQLHEVAYDMVLDFKSLAFEDDQVADEDRSLFCSILHLLIHLLQEIQSNSSTASSSAKHTDTSASTCSKDPGLLAEAFAEAIQWCLKNLQALVASEEADNVRSCNDACVCITQ
jgi:hypothetical protein